MSKPYYSKLNPDDAVEDDDDDAIPPLFMTILSVIMMLQLEGAMMTMTLKMMPMMMLMMMMLMMLTRMLQVHMEVWVFSWPRRLFLLASLFPSNAVRLGMSAYVPAGGGLLVAARRG